MVGGTYTAEFHKQDFARFDSIPVQSRLNGLHTVGGIGLNGGGGQAVPHHKSHLGVLPQHFTDDFLIDLVKSPSLIRAGQVLVLVLTQGVNRDKLHSFHKLLIHHGEYRILRRRMVSSHTKLCDRLIPRSRSSQTDACRGFAF